MRLLIAVGVLLAMLQIPAAAFGRVYNAPWCVEYVFLQNAVSCSFYTFQQCEEARSGVGGYCYRNPRRRDGEDGWNVRRRSRR